MAKQGGMGDVAYVDGYDLGGDVTALSRIGGGPAAGDVTGIKRSAFERIGLLRDGAMEFTTAFNDATTTGAEGSHTALKTLPTADRLVSYFRGQAVGSPAASLVSKQINYDATRGTDGSLFFAVSAQANGYGIEWGDQYTAGAISLSSGTVATGRDGAASTAFGATAYVHVLSFTGTSAFVGFDHSNDNAVGDPYASLASLEASVTSRGAVRTTTTPTTTIKRWTRLYVSGTFSQITLAVNFVRYLTAQS